MLRLTDRACRARFISCLRPVLLVLALFPVTVRAVDPVMPTARKGPLKIFCIGDSITQGYGLTNASGQQAMAYRGYPAKLGELLGAQAKISHYGAGGTTYFRNGPHPFEKTAWLAYLGLAKPDVVTMAFGTNCSRKDAWPKLHDQYAADIHWLITQIRKVSPQAAIYVCLPPPAYSDMWDIS